MTNWQARPLTVNGAGLWGVSVLGVDPGQYLEYVRTSKSDDLSANSDHKSSVPLIVTGAAPVFP